MVLHFGSPALVLSLCESTGQAQITESSVAILQFSNSNQMLSDVLNNMIGAMKGDIVAIVAQNTCDALAKVEGDIIKSAGKVEAKTESIIKDLDNKARKLGKLLEDAYDKVRDSHKLFITNIILTFANTAGILVIAVWIIWGLFG